MSALFAWLSLPLALGQSPALLDAAEAELQRAMSGMKLPDQPAPYMVTIEVIDGQVGTASSSFGVPASYDHSPYRSLRTEVRVGDYTLDNTNFDAAFGEREGVSQRGLPADDVSMALRREMWLALDTAYKGAAEQLSAKLAAREGQQQDFPPDLSRVPPLVTPVAPAGQVDGQRVRDTAEALTLGLRDWPDFEEGSAIARDWQGTRMIVNSEGTRGWLPTGFAVVRVEAITRAEDGARLRNCRWWVARTADGLPSVQDMAAQVDEMAAWLDQTRTAPIERDYLGPVLFEGPASVELFRQLLLPELGGTRPAEEAPDGFGIPETPPPSARVGRRLLPEGWSVVDDPAADLDQAGGYTHDFQGVAARRVELVRDGVVRDLLMSRTPRKDIPDSTGHGRALGADRRTAVPGTVTVAPKSGKPMGKLRRRALGLARQAGLDYVLVVRRIEPPALAEDFRIAFSGDAPLPGLTRPLEAYRLYADGREEPVRGLEFVGVDRRVLRDIDISGATGGPTGVMDAAMGPRRFNIGAVGGLPGTWSTPPVVITELELRGHGGSEPRAVPPPSASAADGSADAD